jgi:cbb3-type cytochrome oxidase subunit 3
LIFFALALLIGSAIQALWLFVVFVGVVALVLYLDRRKAFT